ncbi:1,2-phenylacetyl-CoA epoxidase subunit PaaD [Marinomonas epiphytica]
MPAGELITTDRHGRPGNVADIQRAQEVLEEVMDPEVPVVSVMDLGIVRDVGWEKGHLRVVVTPTYSGCPATEYIETTILAALQSAGFEHPKVIHRLDPAWTTDWITEQGRDRLKAYGVAPPVGSSDKRHLLAEAAQVECPHCGSASTEQLSEFGSTACKALYRCQSCLEPFDYFKCI